MKKKLFVNTAIAILYQVSTIIVGLILPRVTLTTYGSSVNGLASSITQMLGFISFLELGIGVVVQTSLYRPLSQKDDKAISVIYIAAQKYFRVVAEILAVYIVVLCVYYGAFRNETYSWIYTTTLILAISISSFAQYYFGLCNTLLLNADQRVYVATSVNLITIIINAVVSVILMKLGLSIQIVKLSTSLIYLSRPLYLQYYVNRHYKLKKIKNVPQDALKDKWSGMTHHITNVLTGSIDYIVLTLLATFQAVSIYSVYVMPLNSIRNLILTVSTGYKSFFGNVIARGDRRELEREFGSYELWSHFVTTLIFGCSCVVIVPFIVVYTKGVTDANYEDYLFAYLITIAYAVFSLQIPYTSIIFSAGHFRQTQSFCIWECVINIVISVALVKFIGISGVAIGTICAVFYRIVASVLYLEKNILMRSVSFFVKFILADSFSIAVISILSRLITFNGNGYIEWAIYAFIVFLLSTVCTSGIFKLFFPKQMDFQSVFRKVKLSFVKIGG